MLKFIQNKNEILLFIVTTLISILAYIYYSSVSLHLLYGDAQSRLNIARKVIDNLTPGLAQLGNIWLPLPQFIMLPFIWNNYLWHSGLAGYFLSGTSYVLSVLYLYKIGNNIFNSKKAGILMALVALTNINMLYMQTTAMSEMLFILCITGGTYYLLKWIKTNMVSSLVASAFFISASTLTRYEGYFMLAFACLIVGIITFVRYKKYNLLEGTLILFTTLASTGILLWMGYSWTIFGDPIYFARIYSHQVSIISTDEIDKKAIADAGAKVAQKRNLPRALSSNLDAVIDMNGIINVLLAVISIWILFYNILQRKNKNISKYIGILVLFGPILFVVFTVYMGSIPLNVAHFSYKTFLTKQTNFASEYNIRYGMNAIPLVAILVGLIVTKYKKSFYLLIVLLAIQVYTTYYTNFFTIYSLPVKLQGENKTAKFAGVNEASKWLKKNYDDGLIMISALVHDPEMFYLGLNYRTYIHEGAGKYWLESRYDPQKYATWVFMFKTKSEKLTSDSVSKYLVDNKNLKEYYDLVYDDNTYVIYKLKDPSTLDESVRSLGKAK